MFSLKLTTDYGLQFSDAFSKSLEIAKMDAERCESIEEKAKVNDMRNICIMAAVYMQSDCDTYSKKIHSIESDYERLKDEITYILKVWLIAQNSPMRMAKVRLNDKRRLDSLLRKYASPCETTDVSVLSVLFNSVPDICCDFIIKNANISATRIFKGESYKNFKNEYNYLIYFGMLPSGKKYGGFVKAIIDFHFTVLGPETGLLVGSNCTMQNGQIAICRCIYNSKIISQEKRLEFFEKLELKEDDCKLWSVTFDLKYPELTYIHRLFGQIS